MLQKDEVLLLHMLWWRQEILLLSWFLQDYSSNKDLILGTLTFYVTTFRFIVVFVSLPSFTLPVEIFLCLFSSCFIYHSLYFFCWLFEWMWWNPGQTDKLYWPHSCLLQSIKEGNDMMQKKHCLLNPSTPITYKILLFKEKFMLLPWYV